MNWISVETMPLPADYRDDILILTKYGGVTAACRFNDGGYDAGDYTVPIDAITHWMPLPPKPEPEDVAELKLEIDQLRHALAHQWFAYSFKNPDEEHPYGFEEEALTETKKHLGSWQRAFAILHVGEPK